MGDILKIKRRNVSFLVYEHESPNISDFWHNENWENFTYEVLENFLDKEHSYIDVGVHLGETILFGAQLSKTCYAVEPDPECIRIASKNIELNNINNIKLIPKALGNNCSKIMLGAPGSLSLGSSATTYFNAELSANSFETESISIPKLVEQENINDLNFIKIDVEGMEDLIIENIGEIDLPLLVEVHTPLLFYKYKGLEIIVNHLGKFKNIVVFIAGRKFKIKANEILNLYEEENNPRGYFSVLAYN